MEQALWSVGGGVALAILLWTARRVGKMSQSVEQVDAHVLPHFVPASPDEIRAGAPDRTMPRRLADIEGQVVDLDTKVGEVAEELRVHVATEEAKADEDREDRAARQAALDERLASGDRRFARIETKLDRAISRRRFWRRT